MSADLLEATPAGQKPREMQLREFYDRLLPKTGRYVLFQNKQNTFHASLDELVAATERRIDTQGLYFATASYGREDNRTQANVVLLQAHRVDLDAGEAKHSKDPDGTYPTQREALASLVAAIKSGLPMPTLIVSSGEGLHVYWQLSAAASPANWKPVAKLFNAAGAALGLKIDTSCTADEARVLRPVGTLHKNGTRVAVLKDTGKTYTNDDLRTALTALVPEQETLPAMSYKPTRSINDDVLGAMADRRDRDAGLIAANCPAMAAFKRGDTLTEPHWRVGAGVLTYCRNGSVLMHEWSSADPRYNQREAQAKFDGWNGGPPRCGNLPICADCKHNGNLSSPVQLGDIPAEPTPKPNPDSVPVLEEKLTTAGMRTVLDTNGQLNVVSVSDVGGRRVCTVMHADSEAANDAITAAAIAGGGRPPSDRAIETYKAKARHEARQSGTEQEIYLRTAFVVGIAYVDLAPGQVARINAEGWSIVDDLTDGVPLFRRGQGAGALPAPEFAGTAPEALRFVIDLLRGLFALTAEQSMVIVATLLEWHRTDTPHPILELVGPGGSGKSTLAEYVLSMTDPAADGRRLTVGTRGEDVAAAAQQRHVLLMDNASRLDRASSDQLCVMSTGGTVLVRQLYTNGATANLKLHSPVLITAVSAVATAPDLQLRVNRIDLPARMGGYAAESELRLAWANSRPRMLGALYTLLANALRELPAVRARADWGHRLVDFDQMGEAMAKAAGLTPGTFVAAVTQMRERMARRSASGDMFLTELLRVLRDLATKPTHTEQPSLRAVMKSSPARAVLAYGEGRIEITARPGAIRELLRPLVGVTWRENPIPATDRGVTDALRRVQPLLASMGVAVDEVPFGSKTLIRFDFVVGAVHED